MAQFTRLRGATVTLTTYASEDDEENDIEEGRVSIVRVACIANLSGGSMISANLARSLGLGKSELPIKVSNRLPFARNGLPFDAFTVDATLRVEHDSLPGWFVLVSPIIVPGLFYDIILGGPSIRQYPSPLLNPTHYDADVTEGPGYVAGGAFTGHNFQYENRQDEDDMLMYTSIFTVTFKGASRGSVTGGASAVYEYKPSMYGDEVVWFDSVGFGENTMSEDEAAYHGLRLGLGYCRDQLLEDTSICISSDNKLLMLQLRGEEAVVSGSPLKALHLLASALLEELVNKGNRISYCLVSPEANEYTEIIANRAISVELGIEHEEDDGYDVADDEALARSILGVYDEDPTLLSLQDIKDGWGSCADFLLVHDLNPWFPNDEEKAKAISRTLKMVTLLCTSDCTSQTYMYLCVNAIPSSRTMSSTRPQMKKQRRGCHPSSRSSTSSR